ADQIHPGEPHGFARLLAPVAGVMPAPLGDDVADRDRIGVSLALDVYASGPSRRCVLGDRVEPLPKLRPRLSMRFVRGVETRLRVVTERQEGGLAVDLIPQPEGEGATRFVPQLETAPAGLGVDHARVRGALLQAAKERF